MKKLLFLLLLITTVTQAQVATGNEAYFDYGIQVAPSALQIPVTPVYIGTIGADGTFGKIDPVNLPFIQNQNSILQTANFKISGTDSYFGTTKFFKSASSSFPVNFKTASGSFNIETVNNDDINLAPNGTGQVNITGGWGLGFKPVVGLDAGPDFGTSMGGMAYRVPTESMTKNFLIMRFGQYVFEDDTASWKMIITPTGVNIGGGATGVGGAIPMSMFEVNGNAVIGADWDRVYAAPTNGLLVQGVSGFGTQTPSTNFIANFASNSSGAFPSTSGTVQVGATIRIKSNTSTSTLDFGNNNASGAWLQATNVGNLSTTYPIHLNPNGGGVTIGTTTASGALNVGGTISSNSQTITTSPTTSAATYDILTRNTSTGVVEKVPTPKVYNAVITQTSTGAPTVVVSGINTIGSIVWTRSVSGVYIGTLTGVFTNQKTLSFLGAVNSYPSFSYINTTSVNTVTINTLNAAGVGTDGLLTNTPVKIEVYP